MIAHMPSRILVVEDEPRIAGVIEDHLTRLGYEVVGAARSGADALALAGATRPDLALMDIQLRGDVDGIATAQRLRIAYDIPTVYLSAYADDETIRRAKLSEPFGYVLKPFDDRDLHAAIEVALQRHRLERQLQDAEARYRALFERSLAGIFVATADGAVLECNAAFAATLGYESRDELLGLRLPDLMVEPDEWGRLVVGVKIVAVAANLELRLRRRDGAVIWALAGITRIGEDAALSIEGQIVDITERRRAEMATRARETLQAVASLARATAHEINITRLEFDRAAGDVMLDRRRSAPDEPPAR
jgi:PAS domain S-box-containing protein